MHLRWLGRSESGRRRTWRTKAVSPVLLREPLNGAKKTCACHGCENGEHLWSSDPRTLQVISSPPTRFPESTLTWLRSQLEEHLRAEERRLRVVVLRQALVCLAVWIVVALSLCWIWPTIGVIAAAGGSSDPLVYFPLLGTLAALSVGAVFMFLRLRGTFAR